MVLCTPACWCCDTINFRARLRLLCGNTASFSFEINRHIHSPETPSLCKVSRRYTIALFRLCRCSRMRIYSHTAASSAMRSFSPSRMKELYTGESYMLYDVSTTYGPVAVGGCTAGGVSVPPLHTRGRLVSLCTTTSRPSPFAGPVGGGIVDTTRVVNSHADGM